MRLFDRLFGSLFDRAYAWAHMDLHDVLTIITVGGLAISFIAALVSQVWKGARSPE